MSKSEPNFGRGLAIQLLLTVVFSAIYGVLGYKSFGIATIVMLGTQVFSTTLSLGLLYGFFRIFGLKVKEIDSFYDQFPFGYLSRLNSDTASTHINSTAADSASKDAASTEPQKPVTAYARPDLIPVSTTPPINWEKLLNPESLRWLGLILILSAVSSLLFKVEWSLGLKLVSSLTLGIVFSAASIFYKKRSRDLLSAILCTLGFGALQFSLSLGGNYLILQSSVAVPAIPDLFLLAKFIVTLVFVLSLRESKVSFLAPALFLLAYISPLSMRMQNLEVSVEIFAVFLIAMQMLFLFTWSRLKLDNLWVLASIAASYLIFDFTLRSSNFLNFNFYSVSIPENMAVILLLASAINLALLYTYSANESARSIEPRRSLLLATIGAHCLLIVQIYFLADRIPLLQGHLGILLIASSIAPFLVGLYLSRREETHLLSQKYINLTILVGSLGLFLEANDPWAALVFLAFACLITWYALRSGVGRTKVYAAIILGLSILKLYTEAQEVFESIPGNFIVIGLGGFLLLLSYKFSDIKNALSEKERQ